MRLFFSIVTGYLMFIVASTLLVQFSGSDAHAGGITVTRVAFGMCFAFVGGYWASKCAKRRSLTAAAWVGGLIAMGAVLSIVQTRSDARWSQLSALCMTAPSAVAGGWLHRKLEAA